MNEKKNGSAFMKIQRYGSIARAPKLLEFNLDLELRRSILQVAQRAGAIPPS